MAEVGPDQVTTLSRSRTVDESHRAGLDAVLRAVLPHRAVSDPETHQHLSDAVGPLEVPTAPWVQESKGVVGCGLSPLPPRIRPLAMDPRTHADLMGRAV